MIIDYKKGCKDYRIDINPNNEIYCTNLGSLSPKNASIAETSQNDTTNC